MKRTNKPTIAGVIDVLVGIFLLAFGGICWFSGAQLDIPSGLWDALFLVFISIIFWAVGLITIIAGFFALKRIHYKATVILPLFSLPFILIFSIFGFLSGLKALFAVIFLCITLAVFILLLLSKKEFALPA